MAKKHYDFEPFELAENMQEDLGMFEAATHSRRLQLEQGPVSQVLLVVDDGPLTTTVRELGNHLARRLNASAVEHSVADAQRPKATESISRVAEDAPAGLIVMGVPCGAPQDAIAQHSLGTIVDQLLQSSKCPLLCVKQPLGSNLISSALDLIQVAIARDDQPSMSAISWAFRLTDQRTKINLIELADRTSIEDAQQLLGASEEIPSVQEAVIGRAVTSRLGSLVSLAQREASARKLKLHVDFRLGVPVREVLEVMQNSPLGLMIIPRPADHASPGYHLAVDVLLQATQPVLIV
ncbi:MAG: universal stress protein [Pirellulaceae bacterium]|nr:universal stress protein [Pirellulaceae bacterium]